MDFGFRYYQKKADEAIYDELFINNKCIVKMFCGTGKSRLMRYCRITQNKNLVVYVVPSLSLLDQFYTDYFIQMKDFPLENILRISSEGTKACCNATAASIRGSRSNPSLTSVSVRYFCASPSKCPRVL